MGYSKAQKILFALLCLFIILFPFWCVRGLCAETENVDFNVVNGVGINSSTGIVVSASSDSVGYFPIEPGFTYTVTRNSSGSFRCGFSNEIPYANLQLEGVQSGLTTFTFTYSDYQYFYFNFGGIGNNIYTVTREPLEGMTGSVDLLSAFVGPNIWESFTNSLPFVLPLVLVCFGMYLISYFVNKNSKGV